MKLIKTFRSPNFNKRKANQKISYLVLHYTAIASCQESLNYLCDKENKVSAHFLVSKNGEIYYLVDLKNNAWHAGESYWQGLINLNNYSIGIEIDNSGPHIYNENYQDLQIKNLCKLIKKLIKEFNILPKNVLGHSDIAPFRKIDPGEKFPWYKLNSNKLSYLPNIHTNILYNQSNVIKKDYLYSQTLEVLNMLGIIGYDTRGIKVEDSKFELLIKAYQRHYRQSNVSGQIDQETISLIKQHYKDVLT